MSTTTQPAATAPPPSGPRRGGRRGGGGGARGGKTTGGGGGAINAAAAQPDDTEEVRKLRTKYADKLALLRELFPSWTDEDLLFALQEAGGEMELAVGRISEGHAEQFSSVKSKKQAKKETGSVATPITFQGAAAPAASGAAAAGSGSRGGRGGVVGATREGRGGASFRGARGGRGGLRGSAVGRGGSAAPKVDGKSVPDTTVTSSGNAGDAKASATWADALAATSKSNGTAGASWGDDTDGLDLNTTAQGTTGTSTKATDSETASKGMAAPAETSSQQEEPGMVASALAKILPSKLVPKGSKMSWAQVARPADPPKPFISEPTLISVNSAPAATKEATTVAHKVETSKAPAPPIKSDVVAESPSAPIAAPAVQEAKPLEATSAATVTAPPGLNNEDATAPAPAPVAEASTEIAAGSTAGEKPSMPRSAQSQRALQRAKQQEAVVMAGNNAQYDNLGVRFGSLNFLGGEDNDAQTEDPTTAAAPAPAPATAAPEGGAYSDRFSQAAQPVQPSTTASGPTHVQQQTQTVPTHQDAFTQATSSPSQFNASKPEAVNAHQYGYQQGLAQHQQAHQAAVAQTQQQSQQHQQGPQQASSAISQLDQQSAYSQTGAGNASGGFGAPHSAQAQQQAGSQYGEYYGGLDSQRMSSFYGNYDQQGGLSARGNDDRNAHAQTAGVGAPNEGQQQPHHAPQGTPQQQQQFPNVMPYYYPHYYLPNQFQHYGQPGGGYGQYALYGQQPQHPSKPAAPAATVQSPYSQQNGPADLNANAPYGSSAAGQYNQSPAASSALAGSGSGYVDGGFGRQAGNASANDYSKLYGSTATPGSTHSSSIPGLGGFLGQSPAGGANGGTPQMKNGPSHALENAYRQYDNGKVNSASSGPAQQQQQSQQQGQQRAQLPQSSGQPGQGQQQPQQGQGQAQQQQQQQQQPGVTPQQQQQYYQQYNAYAGLQPSAATGSYGNYPYRQYWG